LFIFSSLQNKVPKKNNRQLAIEKYKEKIKWPTNCFKTFIYKKYNIY